MSLHAPSLKLASVYLAILMAISIFFSVILYTSYVDELEHSLRRPNTVLDIPAGPGFSEAIREQIIAGREAQFEQAKQRLLVRLIFLNACIMCGAGILSYFLAERTVRPIEAARDAQSQFTADASHELRTPIAIMKTENEISLLDPKLTVKAARAQLQSNIAELDNITTLIEGLLELAHADDSGLSNEHIAVPEIITDAVNRLSNPADQKKIAITYEHTTTPLPIQGNRASLTEAIVILLDNAIKYSPASSNITIASGIERHRIYISIQDEGPGIDSQHITHIFDRFYRADVSRTKQTVHGYGLGLAIAQAIINKHGGVISVANNKKTGSTFTIHIPIIS